MSGIIVPILEKTIFDFTFLSAATPTKTVVIQRALNVVPFYYAKIVLRVHNINIVAGGTSGTFKISATGTDPSDEDPQEFVIAGVPTLLITLNNASTAPSLLTISDSNLDPYLKITIQATQNAVAPGALFAELSADLLLREC